MPCSAQRRQLDVPEHDGDAFALETDVALGNVHTGRLVLELAINGRFYSIAFAGDLVFIPAAGLLLVGIVHAPCIADEPALFRYVFIESATHPNEIAGAFVHKLRFHAQGPDFFFAIHVQQDTAVAGLFRPTPF